MSQNDMVIDNQAGAPFRADLNSALAAQASNQSGSVAPTAPFPYQFWADTGSGLLKQRNGANTAWTTIGALDTPNLGALQAGAVVYLAHANAAAGFLLCNGGAVSRTTYATLFGIIGTTYGTGDGSTTFNLPELRGEFIRVLDNSRGVDAGRAIGSAQAGQNASHTHASVSGFGLWEDGPGTYQISPGTGVFLNRIANTASSGGTEARPRNVALPAYIKF